jgi:hypothetical protein
MKRDFDLIRRILTDVEQIPAGERYDDIEYSEEYEKATVYEHAKYLIDEGYIKGKVVGSSSDIDAVCILGLTAKGYDFIQVAKDDSIWIKAKDKFIGPAATITLDLLLEWLKVKAKEKLGLA